MDQVEEETIRDNELAADRACLKLISLGYAWNGTEWVLVKARNDQGA